MAILVDIMFLAYTFGLVLLCGFFPRIPAMAKNATLTLLGQEVCEHDKAAKDKPTPRRFD